MYIKALSFNRVKRYFFFNVELRIKVLKYILNSMINFKYLNYLKKSIFFLKSDFFYTKIKNICILTGRQGGIYRYFRVSRITLRSIGGNNLIYGLRKSSW